MSPILFSIFINQLLDEVEKAGIGITVKKDVKIGGLMFADDFVGLTTNAEDLQTLINIVQGRLIQVHVHGSGEIKTFQRL